MKDEEEIKKLDPLDIVSIDGETALGVFSLEQLRKIQLEARQSGKP